MMAPAAIMAAPIVVCTCLYTYESRRRTYTCRVCCSMAGTISAACVLFLLTAETGSTTAEASTAATSNGGRDGRLRESVPVSTPAPAACNVSGTWCWQHSVPPMVFDETAAVAAGSSTNFTISNPTGQVWKLAHGVLRPDRTLSIDYGCGRGPPCQVTGSVDAVCSLITVAAGVPGSGTFSRHCPPPPPPPPPQPVPSQPRTFEGDVAWLGEAAIYLQGSSRLFTAEETGSRTVRALYSPNMQPGGYGALSQTATRGTSLCVLAGAGVPDSGPGPRRRAVQPRLHVRPAAQRLGGRGHGGSVEPDAGQFSLGIGAAF